jgi:hypothetical protein
MRDLPEPGGPVINSDSAKDQDSVSKKGTDHSAPNSAPIRDMLTP